MIKLIATALVAIVAAVSQTSAWSIEDETSMLWGDAKLFADFCIEGHRNISADIRSQPDIERRSPVLHLLFVEQLSGGMPDKSLDVNRKRSNFFISVRSVKDEPLTEDQVRGLIDESLKELRKLDGVVLGMNRTIFRALYDAANSATYAKLAQLRTKLDRQSLNRGVLDACAQVQDYEAKFDLAFAASKRSLLKQNGDPFVRDFIQSVSWPTLECQTTRLVSRLAGFCDLLTERYQLLLSMIGSNNIPTPAEREEAAMENLRRPKLKATGRIRGYEESMA